MSTAQRITLLAILLNMALSALAVSLLYKDPSPLEALQRMFNPPAPTCFVAGTEFRRPCNVRA